MSDLSKQGDREYRYSSPARDFTKIPNGLLRNCPDLRDGERLTLLAVLSYAWDDGQCFPLQATLARARGTDTRTVRRHLRALKDKGYLRILPRGHSQSKLILLLPKTQGEGASEEIEGSGLQEEDTGVRDLGDSSVRGQGMQLSSIQDPGVSDQDYIERDYTLSNAHASDAKDGSRRIKSREEFEAQERALSAKFSDIELSEIDIFLCNVAEDNQGERKRPGRITLLTELAEIKEERRATAFLHGIRAANRTGATHVAYVRTAAANYQTHPRQRSHHTPAGPAVKRGKGGLVTNW